MNTRRATFFPIVIFFLLSVTAFGQDFFPDKDLMSVGVYYYPEHWPESQRERDIKNIAAHGFKFIHMAEFSWAMLEPEEGKYDFSWLDEVVEMAGENGLKVILGTPTPCPPAWMGIKYPEIYLMDAQYDREQHGTRANMSLTNPLVMEKTKQIVNALAKHYAKNRYVMGWQIDNEPESKEDYSPSAQKAFKKWLKDKYGTIDQLNDAWGLRFWSQLFHDFDEVHIYNAASVGWWGANPMALMDFKRFTADMQAAFLDMQAEILKENIKETQFVTTNYVAKGFSTDPRRSTKLDFASFTAYPNYGSGNLGDQGFRLGDYNVLMYANDYYSSLGKETGVMELQPGQVNWGNYNPLLLPGTVRMWLWHCFGGGSAFACTYRYRQILYGAEQYHAGITNTDGISLSQGGAEYVQVIQEMEQLKSGYNKKSQMPDEIKQREAAILWDLDNLWSLSRQKQIYQWNTWNHLHKYHRILKSMGAPVRFISESDDFSKYKFLIVPAYEMVDSALVQKWEAYVRNGGNLIISCRTGAKNKEGHLWESNVSGIMNDLIGGKIQTFDMLPDYKEGTIEMEGKSYKWNTWAEQIVPDEARVLAKYSDQFYKGKAGVVQHKLGKGTVWYIGLDTNDGELEKDIMHDVYQANNVSAENYPEGVLVYWRDGFRVAVNYASTSYTIKHGEKASFLIGDDVLEPADVAVWKE